MLERYAFAMAREDIPVQPYHFPEGYEVRPFREGLDEKSWCHVRNSGFATLKGSETPMTEEMVKEMNEEGDAIRDGLFILYYGEMPVGVVRGFADEHENLPAMGIGPLALLPEYQGKGLGTLLLRYALEFAKRKSYPQVILSVNGENLRAKELYIREGFKEVTTFACYRYPFTSD
ncbi:MAG TPA: GNAT family N-acetyltransferase [Clostridiaceae bacterium]|nr:GNAT family N-acetyltransferase [Clostridiaceae bacterium]